MLQACNSYKNDQERIDRLWQSCSDAIYSITTREKQLGMKDMVCSESSFVQGGLQHCHTCMCRVLQLTIQLIVLMKMLNLFKIL